MEQFSLDTWLQDKSRKVTTRLGNREVRIICWDRKSNNNRPIITLMIDPDGNEYTTFHTKNGFVDETEKYIDKRDLFFADEEDEKIRQALLQCCDDWGKGQSGIMKLEDVQRIRAWLEKQKVNPFSGTFFKYNGDVWGMCARDNGIDVLLNGILFSHLDKTKNQEWSEEDEYCRNQLVVFCENCMQQNSEAIKCANWLKSLKPNHWKPSEEQMSLLLAVINEPNNASSESCHLSLEKLYEDLKKL